MARSGEDASGQSSEGSVRLQSPFYGRRFYTTKYVQKVVRILSPGNSLECRTVLHFTERGSGKIFRLRKDAVPSVNLPKRPLEGSPSADRKRQRTERLERFARRRALFTEDKNGGQVDCNEHDNITDTKEAIDVLPDNKETGGEHQGSDSCTDTEGINSCTDTVNSSEPTARNRSTQTPLPPSVQDESSQTAFQDTKLALGLDMCTATDVLCSDEAMNSCAGLSSLMQFTALCKSVEYTMSALNIHTRYQLDVPSRILLTFMKLKLNLSFRSLSCFFRISEPHASRYFFHTIGTLDKILNQFITWLPIDTIKDNMPIYFRVFDDTRAVLDCAETPVQTSNCLNCAVRTYSYYKGRHTLKFLLAVAPDGVIIFVSALYGGRASDKFIVHDSGILEKCESGTAVMVDKGFDINDECMNRNIKLYRPPFYDSTKKQFTAEEVEQCRAIARARVHVERTIQRVRLFDIFKSELPWSIVHYGDKILSVICAVVNLSPPILSDERFE